MHLPFSKAQSSHLFSSPHFLAKSLGRLFLSGPKYFHVLRATQQRSCCPRPRGLFIEVEEKVFHTNSKMTNVSSLCHLPVLKVVYVKQSYFFKSSTSLQPPNQDHNRATAEQNSSTLAVKPLIWHHVCIIYSFQ